MKTRKFNEKDKDEICRLYIEEKWTQKLIYEKYHCSPQTIRNVLKERQVNIRSHPHMKDYKINEDYFNKIDSEAKAYFLGLLFTDGNVFIRNKSGQISLEIHIQDKEILDKFKQEVNSNNTISYRKRRNTETVCFRISSYKMCLDLSKYGIIPNKTKKTKTLPDIPNEFKKDFIRGLIDGDGSIYQSSNKYNHVTFCSYQYNICNQLQNWCDELINSKNKAKILKDKGKEIYRVHYNNQEQVKRLVTVLYKDSNFYLARKYSKAKAIFEDKSEEDIV